MEQKQKLKMAIGIPVIFIIAIPLPLVIGFFISIVITFGLTIILQLLSASFNLGLGLNPGKALFYPTYAIVAIVFYAAFVYRAIDALKEGESLLYAFYLAFFEPLWQVIEGLLGGKK